MKIYKYKLYSGIFVLLYLFAPQLILKPTTVDELSIIDLLAPISLVFIFFREKLIFSRASLLGFLFLAYTLCIFLIRMIFSTNGSYEQQIPYIFRLAAILCPVFLADCLPLNIFSIGRWLKSYAWVSLIILFAILFLYSRGSTAFDARQTYDYGTDQGLVHRLGGLPGETGAFAFNSLFVCEVALAALVLKKNVSFIYKGGVWAFVLIAIVLSVKFSLARVIIINFAAFLAAIFIFGNASLIKKILIFSIAIFLLFAIQFISLKFSSVAIDRIAQITSSNADNFSSGRLSHWRDAIDLMISNPFNIVFGIGNRMSSPEMGHVTENYFLNLLLEYGIIGFLIFSLFLYRLIFPIFRWAIAGNELAAAVFAIWIAAFVHWQINDIITYYQTFPGLLLISALISNDFLRGGGAEIAISDLKKANG